MEEPVQDERNPSKEPLVYPAGKARQGQIVLNTPARRFIFFGGLVAFVLLAIVLRFFIAP